MSEFVGSCLCGAVGYRASGDVSGFYHCHCGRCRKASGTGHATNMLVRLGEFSWLRGESRLGSYKVPEAERFTNVFCTCCGSRMPRVMLALGGVMIPAGSLDQPPEEQPQARIFWDSRAEWSCPAGDLPVFAASPVIAKSPR